MLLDDKVLPSQQSDFFSPFFFIAQYPVLTGLASSEKSIKYKSSRSQMFFKTAVLKNLAIFPGKHLCWSLLSIFNKVAALQLY